MKALKDNIAREVFGKTVEETGQKCIKCGKNALHNCYSEAGRKEVKISGLCEVCFDNV